MKAVFFDASPTMLAKNLLPISNYFSENLADFEAIFISAEASSNVDSEIDKQKRKELAENCKYRFEEFKSFNKNRIKRFLEYEKPNFIFFDAYRIFDQVWIGVANELRIKCFKLQHGFEVDSVYYKPLALFTKFRKGLRFTYAAFNLAMIMKANPITLFIQYFKYIFMGTSLQKTHLADPSLHPSKVFVFSEYYKKFWNKKFGFRFDTMVNITPYDFLIIDQLSTKKTVDACCYITQTLVEDGRMKKSDFLSLMQKYLSMIKSVNKFIIKLHPRADRSLYKIFENVDNVEIVREFPKCTAYLTHYSSMAFTAAFLSNTVIIHELYGHPTPDIFKHVSNKITTDTKDVKKWILSASKSDLPNINEKKRELLPYSLYEDIHPTTKIYNSVMETISH